MANYSKNKKYHFTYKTTNLINGRYYLGMHSTNRIDDGYLGSGKRLYYEINKYGRDSFKLEILQYFGSRNELVEAEKSLITEQDISSNTCLNLKPGGCGGWIDKEHQKKASKAARKKLKELWEFDKEFSKKMRERMKQLSKGKWTGSKNPNKGHWKGRKHSQETKNKISESSKGKGSGNKNSQFGTCWITDEENNKKVYKGDKIPIGWRLGRTIKK